MPAYGFPLINEVPTKPHDKDAAAGNRVELLQASDEAEVLDFLKLHPSHSVILHSWIRDFGLQSPQNRGEFYGCRNARGELTGVALIGRHTLPVTRTATAIRLLAQTARTVAGDIRLVLGEEQQAQKFWQCFTALQNANDGLTYFASDEAREVLLEVTAATLKAAMVTTGALSAPLNVRRAVAADLTQVAVAHAALHFQTRGVNPLHGSESREFSDRCAERIARGRVWVWERDGEIVFKADVISQTPETTYLEGVYVAESERGRGVGTACLASLARQLLVVSSGVTLLTEVENTAAINCYHKVGFSPRAYYRAIFLSAPTPETPIN